jgi:uncharacterized membrane protein
MDALDSLLMFLGSSVCHQLAERSYSFGDTHMPLCARCAGLHLGFLLSMTFLWTGGRRYASSLPSRNGLILLGAVMSLVFIDTGLSYSGLLPSDNVRRTLSGLALGVPLPFVLVPLLNMTMFPGRNPRSPIADRRDWLWPVLIYAFGAAAILSAPSAYPSFLAVSVAGVAGVFVFFSAFFLVMLSLSFEGWTFGPRARATASVVLAFSVLMILAVVHGTYFPDA